jgi:hypothetical protein
MRYVMIPEVVQNDLAESKFIPDDTKGIGLWFPYSDKIEPIKIRDRVSGSNKGSGPFFGANISQSIQNFWLGYEGGNTKRWHYVTCNFFVQAGGGRNWFRHCMDDGAVAWSLLLTPAYSGGVQKSQVSGSIYRNSGLNILKYSIDIEFGSRHTVSYLQEAARKVASIDATNMTQNEFGTIVRGMFPYPDNVRVALNYKWAKSAVWSDNLRDYIPPKVPQVVYDHWYDAMSAWDDSIMSNRDASGYSAALEAAVESLPQSSVNAAENMLDIVDGIKDILASIMTGDVSNLITFDPSNILSNAEDAWMAYRYMYTTSIADLQEYASLTGRLADLLGKPRFKAYGSFVDGPRRYECTMSLSTDPMIPKGFRDWLTKYGLKLSAANYWDMIPYSFVVDWFTGLGNLFSQMDQAANSVGYRSKACWYSMTYEYEGVNTYTRLPASSVPVSMPRITFHQASKKTLVKRFVDGVCLIGG